MKKFKTKRKFNKRWCVFLIGLVLFLFMFIYLSMFNLHKSYLPIIELLYKKSGIIPKQETNFLKPLISNLDYLISDYLFIENNSYLAKNEIKPIIYLYNTHDKEQYRDNEHGFVPTVLNASSMLKENLKKYNVESFIETNRVSNYLDDKPYSYSYKISRSFLEQATLKNTSFNYFIDIHRDSVLNTHIKINEKPYAKLMFVLGLDNPNYLQNKALMIKLNNYLNKYYEGLSKGIYEKGGKGVDGVYNQDFHKNVLLIEIGGIDNTLEEVFNSTEVLAKALYYVIGD